MLRRPTPRHPHHVTKVTAGTRYAVTIAFTCDERAALEDFLARAPPDEGDGQ